MKKIYTLLTLCIVLLGLKSQATIWDVNVANNSFTPNNLTVIVGDTIRWHLTAGQHTTTSTSVPATAAAWDHTMGGVGTTFDYIVTVVGPYAYRCVFHGGMNGQFTASPNTGITTPAATLNFVVASNNGGFIFSYQLGKSSNINLSIIDVTGKMVKQLVSEQRNGGDYSENYDFSDLTNGIYIVQFIADNQRITRRIVVE